MGEATLESSYDLVIVGSGGGSMCAALAARALGKRPVVLEKQSQVGGSTSLSGGVLWIPDNPLMAREGVADSYARARRYFDAAVPYEAPCTSPRRRETYLRVGPRMVEFLEARGMEFFRPEGWSDYYDDLPGGEPRSRCLMAPVFDVRELGAWASKLLLPGPTGGVVVHSHELPELFLVWRAWAGKKMALRLAGRALAARVRGRRLVANGAAIQGRMLQIALREGIPVFPDTAVRDLVYEDGRVRGVLVERGGESMRIDARDAVLLDAGGFSRNGPMREKYGRHPTGSQWTAANAGDTGEVLESAMRLGAATDCLDTAWWVVTSRHPDGSWPEGTVKPDGTVAPFTHHIDLSLPYSLMVDQAGERYCDEAGSYMEVGERMYERHRASGRAIPSWTIFDSRHRRWYPWGMGPFPGQTPKSWLESGYMKKASSLRELAELCGIDADGLERTIERFNGFCRDGVDRDFGRGGRAFDRCHGDPTVRPNPNLGPIERPPFYAVAMYPGDVGTAGGLVTDEFARVLHEDGSAIEGLYATGNITASVMGRTYPGAGASIGASFVFGFIAAHHGAGAEHVIRDMLEPPECC